MMIMSNDRSLEGPICLTNRHECTLFGTVEVFRIVERQA
jgi:hypothetical protein